MRICSAGGRLAIASVLALLSPTIAQTFSSCNPLTSGGCPPDPALGKSVTIDFTQGSSSDFTPDGSPTYDSNGAGFTVAKAGDSPQLNSKWYIMFGHVDFTIKAAPGTGIVSSAVLQSDDLDEIDWEWLGGDDGQVQSNYFGKGQTTTYNRGAFHPNPGNHDGFHKYSIDWTSDQIVWQIDGKTVRVLTQANAEAGQYPQTPMQIKVGAWSGGDSSNAPGTIAWAGGPTNYAAGPFTMYMKSIAVTDYSTGTQYTYSGTDGSWQSIKSMGGKINGNSGGAVPSIASAAAPAITSTSNSAPMPFEGTHKDPTSTFTTPSIYPWIPMPSQTTLQTTTASVTTYPGLPSGWTVNSQGKAVPPSAAPQTPAPGPSSPSALSLASPSPVGLEVTTGWNEQGFPTLKTMNPNAPKSYDVHGFLITSAPTTPGPTGVVQADKESSTTAAVSFVQKQNAAVRLKHGGNVALGAVCGIVGGVMIL